MRFASALLIYLPLLGLYGCGPREINFTESLEGLDEVYLDVQAPYQGDEKFDSLRVWQETLIAESLEKHGVLQFQNEKDDQLPKRTLEFETTIIDVFPGTLGQHYLARMRFTLSEIVRVKRSRRTLDIQAVTWERDYPVTFFEIEEILPGVN